MNAVLSDLNSTALARVLPLDANQLAHRAPAAFADHPAGKTSSKYVFLSTKALIDALLEAGFVATAANQTHSRRGSDPAYARHMLRFQHPRDSVTLVDAIPQIVLINAHDGSSSYVMLKLAVFSGGRVNALNECVRRGRNDRRRHRGHRPRSVQRNDAAVRQRPGDRSVHLRNRP